jgi:hypothetical protein
MYSANFLMRGTGQHYNSKFIFTLNFCMFKNIRQYENLHVTLWLLKDCCWVLGWKIAGVAMILPTIFIAVYIAWRSRSEPADLFHNLAVVLWICANSTWMLGEFFCDDCTRPFAICFFVSGLLVVSFYYLVILPRQNSAKPMTD